MPKSNSMSKTEQPFPYSPNLKLARREKKGVPIDKMESPGIVDVWAENLEHEINHIMDLIDEYNVVAMVTLKSNKGHRIPGNRLHSPKRRDFLQGFRSII